MPDFKARMQKYLIWFPLGLRHRARWGAYSAPRSSDFLAGGGANPFSRTHPSAPRPRNSALGPKGFGPRSRLAPVYHQSLHPYLKIASYGPGLVRSQCLSVCDSTCSDFVKREGNVFHVVTYRYTLSKYISDIYFDGLCII